MSEQQVLSMSQRAAEAHVPRRFEVCVSIRSHGARRPTLSPLWDDVIYVEADDCPFTSWESESRRGLSERDADRIVEFVNRHRACRIYVHCFVGASRSVSVAAAIRAALGLPAVLEQLPNPLAYNRMIAAFQLAADTVAFREAEERESPQEADGAEPFPNRSSAPETATAPVEAGAANLHGDSDL